MTKKLLSHVIYRSLQVLMNFPIKNHILTKNYNPVPVKLVYSQEIITNNIAYIGCSSTNDVSFKAYKVVVLRAIELSF